MASEYHEPREVLGAEVIDHKRAIDAMREELEAVDWYRQRMRGATDGALGALLDHHQREEVEHFTMLLEWLRRRDADFDVMLRRYLFSDSDLLAIEDAADLDKGAAPPPAGRAAEPRPAPAHPSMRTTIGSLRSEAKR